MNRVGYLLMVRAGRWQQQFKATSCQQSETGRFSAWDPNDFLECCSVGQLRKFPCFCFFTLLWCWDWRLLVLSGWGGISWDIFSLCGLSLLDYFCWGSCLGQTGVCNTWAREHSLGDIIFSSNYDPASTVFYVKFLVGYLNWKVRRRTGRLHNGFITTSDLV